MRTDALKNKAVCPLIYSEDLLSRIPTAPTLLFVPGPLRKAILSLIGQMIGL